MVVTCAVTMATAETLNSGVDSTQKPDKELQEKEKEFLSGLSKLLKQFVGAEDDGQLEAVYALQVFCYEKEFPKG